MQLSLKKLSQARTQATVVFEKERVEKAEEAAVLGLGAEVKVKGFREGHAPLPLLREQLPVDRIREEMVHGLLPEAMKEIQEKGVKPIVTPRVELTTLTPLTLTITLVEKPEVRVDTKKLKGVKGKEGESPDETKILDLLADATSIDLAPELIDEEIRDLVKGHARRLEQMGTSLDAWLDQEKKPPEDFLKELRPIAEKRLRVRFGMAFLIEEWKITVSDAEVQEAVTALLAPLQQEERETLQSLYAAGGRPFEQFRYQKMVEKVMGRLRSA